MMVAELRLGTETIFLINCKINTEQTVRREFGICITPMLHKQSLRNCAVPDFLIFNIEVTTWNMITIQFIRVFIFIFYDENELYSYGIVCIILF